MIITGIPVGVATEKQTQSTGYYCTPREELGVRHEKITATYIWQLYDQLLLKYPEKVRKELIRSDDGTFVNYAYVISTGEYRTDGSFAVKYEPNPDIRKPKYLVMSSIHGLERKSAISTYRFVLDLLTGRNVPSAFREGAILNVLPVGTPYAFDNFQRRNENGVDINRNFDWGWNPPIYPGAEKETQVIIRWLQANLDASLFIDFHNNGATHEVVAILGLTGSAAAERCKQIAMQGIDRIIPYWRDQIGYPPVEGPTLVKNADGSLAEGDPAVQEIIFSYAVSVAEPGLAINYATGALGIPSIAIETYAYRGNYSDYADNMDTYQAEPIAAGAEALGNILIEFYEQSLSEVVDMTETNGKLDAIAKCVDSLNKGFYTVHGVYSVPTDISSVTDIVLNCPAGAKTLDFHADSETLAAIKATTTGNYVGGVLANFYAPDIQNYRGTGRSYMTNMDNLWLQGTDYGRMLCDNTTAVDNTNGISFKVNAIKAGTYEWTAYYWND